MKEVNKIFLLLLLLLTLSCRVQKKSSHSQTIKSDTSSITASKDWQHLATAESFYSVKDTVINFPSRDITDTLTEVFLQPSFDRYGNPQSKEKRKQGKGISLSTTLLPSGQIIVQGNCDSLSQTVAGLISQRGFYFNAYSKQLSWRETATSKEKTEDKSTKNSSRVHWSVYLIIPVLAGSIIIYFTRKIPFL